MKPTNKLATAAFAAALCLAPAAAFAQAGGTTPSTQPPSSTSPATQEPGTSQPGTTQPETQPGTTQPSTSQTPSTTGSQTSASSNEEEARQQLSAARTSLAELTKLPEASQLQGEQRTQMVNFISAFNTFATATTDWRGKYDTVDKQLDDLLASAGTGATGTTPSTGEANAPAATGTGGGESGALPEAIVAKLREVRQHLDAFEVASGDPGFIADAIDKVLTEASTGGSSTVGTSGSAGAAGGSVTLTSDQVQQIRKQLDALRSLVKK
jgi:hypothetical protein